MMNIQAVPSRLDFVAAARSAFDFLLDSPYSYSLVEQDEGRVGYERSDVAVVVLHEPLSYELDLSLWRPAIDTEVERPYGISDLMRVTDVPAALGYRMFAATSPGTVQLGLLTLASDLRVYGDSALMGDAEFYESLANSRATAIREFGREWEAKTARKAAEGAWNQEDYGGVVAAYNSIIGQLSEVERARLRVASERIVF